METLLETWTPIPCKSPAFSSQGGCTGLALNVLPPGLRWVCEPWGRPELDVTSSRGPSRAMDLLPLPCSLHLPLPPPCAGSGPIVCPKDGIRSQGNCCKGWGDQTPYSRCLPQCPQDRDPSMRPMPQVPVGTWTCQCPLVSWTVFWCFQGRDPSMCPMPHLVCHGVSQLMVPSSQRGSFSVLGEAETPQCPLSSRGGPWGRDPSVCPQNPGTAALYSCPQTWQ